MILRVWYWVLLWGFIVRPSLSLKGRRVPLKIWVFSIRISFLVGNWIFSSQVIGFPSWDVFLYLDIRVFLVKVCSNYRKEYSQWDKLKIVNFILWRILLDDKHDVLGLFNVKGKRRMFSYSLNSTIIWWRSYMSWVCVYF